MENKELLNKIKPYMQNVIKKLDSDKKKVFEDKVKALISDAEKNNKLEQLVNNIIFTDGNILNSLIAETNEVKIEGILIASTRYAYPYAKQYDAIKNLSEDEKRLKVNRGELKYDEANRKYVILKNGKPLREDFAVSNVLLSNKSGKLLTLTLFDDGAVKSNIKHGYNISLTARQSQNNENIYSTNNIITQEMYDGKADNSEIIKILNKSDFKTNTFEDVEEKTKSASKFCIIECVVDNKRSGSSVVTLDMKRGGEEIVGFYNEQLEASNKLPEISPFSRYYIVATYGRQLESTFNDETKMNKYVDIAALYEATLTEANDMLTKDKDEKEDEEDFFN